MRWDNLFDDLEGQLEHELNAEDLELRAEEERLRLGRLSLRHRLMGLGAGSGPRAGGGVVRLVLTSGVTLAIRPTTFGRDWLAAEILDTPTASAGTAPPGVPARGAPQCVVPIAAIAGVILQSAEVRASLAAPAEPGSGVVDRIGFAFVLRDLARRRRFVEVHTPGGLLSGTIDRVGRDHIDLAMHDRGVPRRSSEVRQYRIIPLAGIQLLCLP
ncbi:MULTISPECIES: hypothetical protein [Cryobacterium]|uniref:Uncharacterized protein n=2 Tax=Cryobacterium TaxID=69578 RepID=A0ABY2IJV2_9MICO|nr:MULTISPECIES: hypothetical protein [Cryobacterium]MDY7526727.1 hypothetical protein [Cryobacterium sp. 10C2]MDY7557468.1 hypothetical protein [Cryobacterium sp. 10C3]MEB0003549.1 hypothetical protein [Cryobacterium sp. RTC2.1]MEB0287192.1 hypothetical protein [Cryobacterium sp. 10S3]MEB0290677.1 hypothetical protein [Cryobacterium sp. 10C2]